MMILILEPEELINRFKVYARVIILLGSTLLLNACISIPESATIITAPASEQPAERCTLWKYSSGCHHHKIQHQHDKKENKDN